jgi:hypothetical protein
MLKALWLSILTPGKEIEEQGHHSQSPFAQRELPTDTADITQSCAVRKREASRPVGEGEEDWEDKQMQRMPKVLLSNSITKLCRRIYWYSHHLAAAKEGCSR